MFGYVVPCRMELKIKDFEKFKAYYCGLCHAIKDNFGNLPRMALNYDMTFLAILIDSLDNHKLNYRKFRCAVHPTKERIRIYDNPALIYAAECNIMLTYYKLIDNINDDNTITSKLSSSFLKRYISGSDLSNNIGNILNTLYTMEKEAYKYSIDEISHHFAHLTGYIISDYFKDDYEYKETLYWLGYNLGKWIYIIDAWDDLEKDMKKGKFNLLTALYNKEGLDCDKLKIQIEDNIDFILTTCASATYEILSSLPIEKNKELLDNILKFGLMEKMDIVFKRSELLNAKPI
ncbi:hypothetical protein IAI10_18800 [Clostridium sp. 19966]|uniref:DUF5685 family protein n=1 Tax=Clostridium sp. 19966 TaxID=2768166 RepID=UPI0028DF346A|nr:DUF5685 family protein [Clostridium sp. 19966]MDT8718710.1 hypothetical protein [Clostridium sp. 19966]